MMLPDLARYPYVAFDFETTGLKWWEDEAFMLSVSLPDGQDIWVDLQNDEEGLRWARGELPKVQKAIAHHAKFDLHFGRESGIFVPPDKTECTIIREALIDENRHSFALDAICMDRFNEGKIDIVPQLAEM